jgi:hypothetical protein
MRKLFDFSDCYGSAPTEPGAETTSTPEDWGQFQTDFEKWYYSCLAGLQPISYPPPLPPPQPDQFKDTKGNVWTRTVSSKGVDFRLDFIDTPAKSKSILLSKSDSLLVVGIRISLTGDYSILTYGHKGVKVQKIKRKKIRLANLLKDISNCTKLPNKDLNTFWRNKKKT